MATSKRRRYGGIDAADHASQPLSALPSSTLRVSANGCLIAAVEALNGAILGDRAGFDDYKLMTRRAEKIGRVLAKRHNGGQLHLHTRLNGRRES